MLTVVIAALLASPQAPNENLFYGIPGTGGAANTTLLERKGFALMHDNERKVPLWVSFRLKSSYISTKARLGSDAFKADPDLPAGSRAELSDYRNSGFDRGHMAASGDMRRSTEIQKESFYLSNIIPQNGPTNRKVWADIEAKFRDYAKRFKDVTVIVGPIFDKQFPQGPPDPNSSTIGGNHVAVPTGFYRIVIRKYRTGYRALALELPNRAVAPNADWSQFIVTVDQVETDTGLNFFNALPVGVQARFEAKKPKKVW